MQQNVVSRHARPGFLSLSLFVLALLLLFGLLPPAARGEPNGTTTTSLSALNGPNGYRLAGRVPGDEAGRALKNAGDVNGDGLDDFIIGASAADPNGKQGAGEAYVVFGGATNPTALSLDDLNGTNGFRLVGAGFNDQSGESVSGGGDVNRDGYVDLLIGAPGLDPNEVPEAGGAYLVFGAPAFPAQIALDSLNGANGVRLNGAAEDNRAGTSVGAAGDLNGDGYGDVMVGAPDATVNGQEGVGLAYVVFGRPTFDAQLELVALNGNGGFSISGIAVEGYAGNVVGAAGDVNGDGYDDALVATWKSDRGAADESGAVYVIYGGPTLPAQLSLGNINGGNGFRLDGVAAGDSAGRSAAAAGDVNGDGRDDVIIGAPYAGNHQGAAYVVLGRAAFPAAVGLETLNGVTGFRLVGDEATGEAGTAVGAADVNGDGLSDLLVGASTAGTGSRRFAGKSYAVFGRAEFEATISLTGLAVNVGLQFDGAGAGDQSGQAISGAGDVNGDGFDEFLIGAPKGGMGPGNKPGFAYLVQGGPTLGAPLPVTKQGGPGDDILTGTPARDVILGGRGADRIDGAAGDDALKGGAGADWLEGGPGADLLVGGNGPDTASFAASPAGVAVNLFISTVGGGDAAGDRLRSIEHLLGSALGDTLTGDAADNRLDGGPGDDALTGGRGDDVFSYAPGRGNDTIHGFAPGAQSEDVLDFTAYPAIRSAGDLGIVQQGADALLTLPGGETIRLAGVAASALRSDDYRFAGAPLARADQYTTPLNTPLSVAAPGVLGNDENPTGAPLTAMLVAAPAHGAATLQANGAFIYTPATGYVGEDSFTYRAHNGQESNVARVAIDVTLVPPTAVADSFSVKLGETLTVAAPGVLGNDQNPGGATLQATLVEEPVHGALALDEDGSFVYTPQTDAATQDSFTYRADNGLPSDAATVTIHILDPDGPAVAVDDAYETAAGKSLTIGAPGVLGNDVNPLPGAMTARLAAAPQHGTVTLKSDGGFTYTPQANYQGQDHFTYQAGNGQWSDAATVTITVTRSGYRVVLPVLLRP